MTTDRTNIVVLGGGYAGILAALRVAGKTRQHNTQVTLVNGLAHFVERPRLHEQAAGTRLKPRPISHMLRGSQVQFLPGWVTALQAEHQQVWVSTTNGEQILPYDYLIYALGSRVDRHTVPGVDQHAYTLDPSGVLAAEALERRLTDFTQRPGRVAVVGGGATGLESATQIKAAYPHLEVTLITQGESGAFKGPRVQEHIRQSLQEQGIAVYEHCSVREIGADGVLVAEDKKIGADLVVWAGGFVAPKIATEAGLQVNHRNQVLTDSLLRSLSHPSIYAVGDAFGPVEEPGAPTRMSVFVALVSGAHAADNITATIKKKAQKPFSFAWYGQGIALGPNDAVGFNTYPLDKVSGPIFRRRLAVGIRNFFLWYLGLVLELERRWPGFLFWNGKGRYTQAKRRQQVITSKQKNLPAA